MSESLMLHLVVEHPLAGVTLRMQRGRNELIAPVTESGTSVTFELVVQLQRKTDGALVLRGLEVQGPPAGRFVYVNAGQYAGQTTSPWGRRAKIPLGAVTGALVELVRAQPHAVLVAEIEGSGRDGGPASGTVPLLGAGWTVVRIDACAHGRPRRI